MGRALFLIQLKNGKKKRSVVVLKPRNRRQKLLQRLQVVRRRKAAKGKRPTRRRSLRPTQSKSRMQPKRCERTMFVTWKSSRISELSRPFKKHLVTRQVVRLIA